MAEHFFAKKPSDIVDFQTMRDITGFEFMSGMLNGLYPLPPIARLMNFHLTDVEKGRVIFKGYPTFDFANPMGTLHGGWYATILDSAMACSIMTTLPKGQAMTTLEFKINLIRAVKFDYVVHTEGLAIHKGRTTAVAEAKLMDADGNVYAYASTTGLLFDIVPGQ